MANTKHFESKEDYHKWLAYAKMHGKPSPKGPSKVKIAGKTHKVDHSEK